MVINLQIRAEQPSGKVFVAVADLEGVQGICSNPPTGSNYFIFMGNFKRFCVTLGKRTPLFI